MNKRTLWLIWYSLFIVCALLGFIHQPQGFWKFCFGFLSVLFFVPGFWLVILADRRDDVRLLRQIRGISIGSLALTTLLIMLNFLSALMTDFWGNLLHGILVVVSTPMLCAPFWALSLFGWACIMVLSVTYLKKRK